jgi:acetyl esterase/lipase
MLDPRAKRFLELLAATNPQNSLDLSVEDRRKSVAGLTKFSGSREPVGDVRDTSVPGPTGPLRVRVYAPQGTGAKLLPGLVFYHGGGFVAGSLDTHDAVSRALTNATGCRVLAVDYRLAPEHRFPAAVDDAFAAAVYIAEHASDFGVDPERVAVAGDSAGATLAAVVCQMAIERSEPRLAAQLLICPITDYGAQTPSRRTLATGYLLDDATLEHDLLHYLPDGVDRFDPRVSPLRARDVVGLPPTFVHTAEFDPLRDEGAAYATRLAEAGVRSRHTCHAGMIHLFYALGGIIPYARRAYEIIGAEVRGVLA